MCGVCSLLVGFAFVLEYLLVYMFDLWLVLVYIVA